MGECNDGNGAVDLGATVGDKRPPEVVANDMDNGISPPKLQLLAKLGR